MGHDKSDFTAKKILLPLSKRIWKLKKWIRKLKEIPDDITDSETWLQAEH